MGFEPFDPFGEKDKQNIEQDEHPKDEGETDFNHIESTQEDVQEEIFRDVPILDEETFATEGENESGVALDHGENEHEKSNVVKKDGPDSPQEVPINIIASAQSSATSATQGGPKTSNYSNQQQGMPLHTPNQIPPTQGNGLMMPAKKEKGRGGIYALLISILVVALLILGIIAWAFFGILGLASSYSDGYDSQYEGSAVTMPEVKPVPTGGRKVPTFGQPAGAYDVQSDEEVTVAIKDAVGPAVVGIVDKISSKGSDEFRSGAGSGIVLSKDGYIITNQHVISNADKLNVVFEGETDEVPADLIGYDEIRDIAVIQVARNDLTPPIFGDSSKVKTGEMSVAIGNPLGTLNGTITQGIISSATRELTLETGRTQNFIQTDTAINPGNSGGALLNRKGEVIGINTRKETTIAIDDWGMPIAAEGIGYAIPINDALSIAEVLIREGKIERAQMGVTLKMVTADMEEARNGRPGVVVTSIVKDGPAEVAGMRKGDIITSVDDVRIESLSDISNLLDKKKIGDEMRVRVWRDGKEFNYTLTLQNLSKND